jgi:hypothetical protein
MISGNTITDEKIHTLEVEAARFDDPEFAGICQRAYCGNGGAANPHAMVNAPRSSNNAA